MADHPRGRGRPGGPPRREPEVRRWPHPVAGGERPLPASARETDAALYYIHCALSYQNNCWPTSKRCWNRYPWNLTNIRRENSGFPAIFPLVLSRDGLYNGLSVM